MNGIYKKPSRPCKGRRIAYTKKEKEFLRENSPEFYEEKWGKKERKDLSKKSAGLSQTIPENMAEKLADFFKEN